MIYHTNKPENIHIIKIRMCIPETLALKDGDNNA